MGDYTPLLIVLFGVNLLLLSFNAGILWNKVGTMGKRLDDIGINLHDLRDSFHYLSGQLSITHEIHRHDEKG